MNWNKKGLSKKRFCDIVAGDNVYWMNWDDDIICELKIQSINSYGMGGGDSTMFTFTNGQRQSIKIHSNHKTKVLGKFYSNLEDIRNDYKKARVESYEKIVV